MRRITCGLVGLFVWSLVSSLRAGLLIEETFTGYLDDVLISASPAGAALGLTGDWTLTPDQNFYVNRTQADPSAGTGKAVYDMPSDDNGERTAKRSTSTEHLLYQNTGDRFYASFLTSPARAAGGMMFELELKNLAGGGVTDFSFGIKDGEYIVGHGGVSVDAFGGVVTTGEHLILVRIDYGAAYDGGSGDNELVTLWVDPVSELSTPEINNYSVDFLNHGGGKISSVSIRGDKMLGGPAFFDNLRVGSSFDSVVPEPSALILLALGFVGMIPIAWRRKRANC